MPAVVVLFVVNILKLIKYKIVIFDEVYILLHFNIIVGSHNYMLFVTTLLKSLLIPSWWLFTKTVFVVFLNRTPIIRIIFVIYYSQPVCISTYSSTTFIFPYLMMNFLFNVSR